MTHLQNVLTAAFAHTPVQIAATIVAALIAHLVFAAATERLVRRAVRSDKYARKEDEEKRENTLIAMFRTASAAVLWIVALVLILGQLGINLAALATGAGLIGIVIGFGAQNIIKDFLGGMFIILENQYRVGDIVKLWGEGGEVAGLVEDITIRITRLRDLDGNMHIVQNGSINIVTNLSYEYANVNVDVGVAYETDIVKVEASMNRVGQSMLDDQELGPAIIEPIQFLRVDGFEASAVRIKALGKVEPAKQWDVAGEFRRRLLIDFEKEGIVIPFQQIVVHKPAK